MRGSSSPRCYAICPLLRRMLQRSAQSILQGKVTGPAADAVVRPTLGLAPTWDWVALANVLLGINQGLCWSMTIVMKIDLVGPKRRGLAMGLNEFAGYGAVALAAWACAVIASSYGLRIAPFVLGVAFASL